MPPRGHQHHQDPDPRREADTAEDFEFLTDDEWEEGLSTMQGDDEICKYHTLLCDGGAID
jgi:hypothetical protein